MLELITRELTPPHPRRRQHEATLSIVVSADDVLRLRALAAGANDPELLGSTFHLGLIESYRRASMPWPANDAPAIAGRPSRGPANQTLRRAGFAAAAVAAIVLFIGSYADHWSWTGLMKNGQVWDWMQLLLLPVALGTFPIWLRFSWEMTPARRRALGAAVLAFAVFVLAGYVVPLRWTGFRGHTLWNWLTLVALPLTITTATLWRQTGRRFGAPERAAAAALAVAWIATVIGGYALGWVWTGYQGNTLWDWVQLLLAPVAISTFVVPQLIQLVSGDAAGASAKSAR